MSRSSQFNLPGSIYRVMVVNHVRTRNYGTMKVSIKIPLKSLSRLLSRLINSVPLRIIRVTRSVSSAKVRPFLTGKQFLEDSSPKFRYHLTRAFLSQPTQKKNSFEEELRVASEFNFTRRGAPWQTC